MSKQDKVKSNENSMQVEPKRYDIIIDGECINPCDKIFLYFGNNLDYKEIILTNQENAKRIFDRGEQLVTTNCMRVIIIWNDLKISEITDFKIIIYKDVIKIIIMSIPERCTYDEFKEKFEILDTFEVEYQTLKLISKLDDDINQIKMLCSNIKGDENKKIKQYRNSIDEIFEFVKSK